eukprot:1589228-Pyramimonas_sp.AAC.1
MGVISFFSGSRESTSGLRVERTLQRGVLDGDHPLKGICEWPAWEKLTATSSNRTPVSGTSWNLDLLLPKSICPPIGPPIPPPWPPWPPWALRKRRKRPPNASSGNS